MSFLTDHLSYGGQGRSSRLDHHQGTKAPQAAGKIHTDFEKGFIRAEVFHYDDLMKLGSEKAVKEAGLLRPKARTMWLRTVTSCCSGSTCSAFLCINKSPLP